MDEFEKIKTFSESLEERQKNMNEQQPQDKESDLNFPQYLSQFRAVPVQEKKESRRLLWIVLTLAVTIVVLVAFALTQRFSSMEDNEIVVIAPTPSPVKILPENPGGLNIPDKDKVVFDRGNVASDEVIVENLFPEIEQPVLPTEVIEPETKDMDTPIFESTETLIAPMDVTLEEIKESPSLEANTEPIEILDDEAIEVPQEQPVEPVVQPQETPALVTNPKTVWRAQLLSSASKAKVESSWKEISQKQKALLSDMPYQIVSATIPGKGTFWRLQVGEFATKEMVVNLCAKLKKKKQECIPVK